MKTLHIDLILKSLFIVILLCVGSAMSSYAQNPSDPKLTRYVDGEKGRFDNDGLSWNTAKNLLQETLNSLHEYMVKNKITSGGRIFVKAGTYVPIGSTEAEGGNVLNTSFLIYEGITVYGGFAGGETAPEERERRKRPSDPTQNTPHGWDLVHETILSGNHSEKDGTTFVWDEQKQKYETTFPGNSYHVVWFATNGFDAKGNAKPLKETACIDGCTITGGNASFSSMTQDYHTAYGGGAYMVKNSVLRNCIIKKNVAARRGGGVFMDGGGLVDGCYIHTNQTLGVGGTEGYGGGVSIEDEGKVTHSPIVNNVARIGGGVALNYNGPMEVNGYLPAATLLPVATSCLIANNTATQEAGGIFFNHGGAINHLTVVRNRCNGADITVRGIRYGRSAGAYILESGQIYNSIFWGGKVEANRDIQMAIHNTSGKAGRARINYSAFENHDITDWTGSIKNTVANLEHKNAPDPNDLLSNYMAFKTPTLKAGVWVTGDGTKDDDYLSQEVTAGHKVKWIPCANSAARDKSVQLLDVHGEGEYEYLKHVDVQTDIHGVTFEPSDEAGAFITDKVDIRTAEIGGVKTLFIDPSHKTLSAETVGNSWTHPLNNLNEALTYFRENNLSGQILIKEGTLNTLGEYYNIHQRSSYIRMVSNVTVKGGYSRKLTGEDTRVRNPLKYVTRISADLAEDDYKYNACHIITFDNVSHAVVDGLHISYANALSGALFEDMSKEGRPQFQHGGGIICWNTKLGPQNGYVAADMTGNKVRNCVISNNSALRGSAVYLHAAAGTSVNLEMENCIIHNNASEKDPVDKYAFSTVYVGAHSTAKGASLTMNHCDILKNVGHPVLTEGTNAKVKMTNSVVWANADQPFDISDYLGMEAYRKHLLPFGAQAVNVAVGSGYCRFDNGTLPAGFNAADSKANLVHLRFINPTKNVGVTKAGDVTKYGGIPDYTPMNMSPLVNEASTESMKERDFTDVTQRHFGGAADIGALENSELKARGQVYYVRPADKGGSNTDHDGLSWNQACANVTVALDKIRTLRNTPGHPFETYEIWVAAGTYKEADHNNEFKDAKYGIQLLDGVSVLGGFRADGNPGKAEGERDLSNSDLLFTTILDGEGKRRVLRGATGAKHQVLIEGLTIQNGKTDHTNYGAGVYLQGNHIMKNCVIQNNRYEPTHRRETSPNVIGGGGVYANNGAVLTSCRIQKNTIEFDGLFEYKDRWGYWHVDNSYDPKFCGAGAFMVGATISNSLVVDNSITITENYYILGAGMYISEASNVYNCTVAYNKANNEKNSVFVDNRAATAGVWDQSKSSQFYNCLFWGNVGRGGTAENFYQIGMPGFSGGGGISNVNLHKCYHSAYTETAASDTILNESVFVCFPGKTIVPADTTNFYNMCKANQPFNADYSLKDIFEVENAKSTAKYCINMGGDEGAQALIDQKIYVDFTGAPRIQDCQIDKGAYEFNATYAITPQISGDQLIYYVNQNGNGVNSGDSPENAACAEKVQLILDAAGRKLAEPGIGNKEIVVRLAGNREGIIYRPHRSSVENLYGEDPRSWSLLIPRGVTVEGGWDENFTVDRRDLSANKTILMGKYNTLEQYVEVYHAVTFTEYEYDEDGKIKKDGNQNPIKLPVTARQSILDGVYIEGGAATGDATDAQYGGAAIVPDFAHIRNCILRNNHATMAGGALFLQPKALVSGCLFENNSAKNGGAVAVEDVEATPHQTETVETRARIYTSTFVNNEATKAGGAISYLNNVRVSSSVFWKNRANTEANIDGKYEDTQHKYEEEDYPFAYCAVENVRMPGINNLSVATDNASGTRFDKISDLSNSDYSYYGLTDFSVLLRTGMPIKQYQNLVRDKQLASQDFMQTARYGQVGTVNLDENINIDMGARSLGKLSVLKPVAGKVLRRLYVTHPEKVSMDVVQKVLDYRRKQLETGKEIPMNAQQGASFAFPMQSLNDALRYVVHARKDANIGYADKAYFEIFISGGTFYPEADLEGKIGISRDNTFLVPEGIAIFGAMDPYMKVEQGYLCQNTPDLTDEQNLAYGEIAPGIKILKLNTLGIIEERQLYDLNANDIYEPWEFAHQTILSGKAINKDQVNNVYHVMTVSVNPDHVGWMGKGVHQDEKGGEILPSVVRLDGLQITDGEAWHDEVSPDLMEYTGGGIYANGIYGEKLGNSNGKPTFGDYQFRPIRLKISHCRFIGNKAGLGGAIMNNVPADISSCSFEQNEVMSQAKGTTPETQNAANIDVKGLGSAIYTTNHVQLINCLFANNEAKDALREGEQKELKEVYGAGTIALFHLDLGVKTQPITGRVSMMNCNIVNNKAQKYPAVFTQSPNNEFTAEKPDHNNTSLMNSIFWGNRSVDGESFSYFNHVINFDKESDLTQANEALWFCAYEEGLGKRPKAGKDRRGAAISYSTSLPRFFQSADTPEGRRDCYNYNIYLNSDNNALDGPNFTNPSLGRGVDKFLPTANWLPYRQNNLTDNGWTYLQQKITNDGKTFTCQFVDANGKPIDPADPQYHGGGAYLSFYNLLKEGNGSVGYEKGSRYGNIGVPIGNEVYMRNKFFVAGMPETYEKSKMLRISLDPNPTHEQTYIDIGLYEYQHVQLSPTIGKEVDLLWVSEREKPDNGIADGSSWRQPTSDLQRAIETLLCSRNGHHKEIRIMEGTYHPVYSFKEKVGENEIDRLAFRMHTSDLNDAVVLPSADQKQGDGVASLTLSGGWSASISGKRDVEENRTLLRSPLRDGVSAERMKYLFDLSDLQQYYGRNKDGEKAVPQGVVIPLTFDGLTFANTIRQKDAVSPTGGSVINYRTQRLTPAAGVQAPAAPKLSVKHCVLMNSGLNKEMAAVWVGNVKKGGGKSLFFNSLFHSNQGPSIIAEQKADVVNCTFAMNGGNLRLNGGKSTLYGNVFWRNNWPSDDGSLKEFDVAEGTNLKNNAYTGVTEPLPGNYALSTDNHDIFAGPNFVDPLNKKVEKRDFHLQPSVRLLNQCPPTDYPQGVLTTDLANKSRLFGEKVDLGAYEYQYELQRAVYVDPLRVNPSGDGKTWGEAFNMGDMQRAIDLAAVYAAGHKEPEEQGYVFMKVRNDRVNTNAHLTLREGVSVYGGIARDFMQVAGEGTGDYETYERLVRDTRPGMVNSLRQNTLIAEVDTKGNYQRLALMDGFEVALNSVQEQNEKVSAVRLSSEGSTATAPIVMRNSIVHGFHKVDCPVVELNNGLLYNVLVRNNLVEGRTHPVLALGHQGWMVNATVVSKDGTHVVAPESGQQFFNIVGKMDDPTFAPYFNENTDLPASFTNDQNLRYQLGEQSGNLDQATADLPSVFVEGVFAGSVDYDTDRDLLGNPRKLSRAVDNGCFETWNAKNAKLMVDMSYAGHHYPHEGSVVYANTHPIEVDARWDSQKVPVVRPGFFLLQKGGGWYGSGRVDLELAYAAVERTLGPDNLVALPFAYDYETKGSQRVEYSENGALHLSTSISPLAVKYYDRDSRAASSYRFESQDSPCWKKVTGWTPANTGVYYGMEVSSNAVQTHRFTSWSTDGKPIYTEEKKPKTVTLHQANTTALNGGKPNFTAMENMGWNLAGQPYMVSTYATGSQTSGTEDYQMNVPHLMYLLADDGGYQTMPSWDVSSSLAAGAAFFTQTAVIKDQVENLTFNFPKLTQHENKEGKSYVLLTSAVGRDVVSVTPSAEAQDLTYHFGADGVKWMAMNEALPQIYLSNDAGSRFSRVSAAPVEKELQLGIRVSEPGEHRFSLSEGLVTKEGSPVWLTDDEAGVVVDLTREDYVVKFDETLDTSERFTLKWGGDRPVSSVHSEVPYEVFIREGILHVEGLQGDEQIRVYDSVGRAILSVKACGSDFSTRLFPGVYIVKVNGNRYKVRS